MSTFIENLLNFALAFAPAGLILGATAFIWLYGSRKNRKILERSTEIINDVLAPIFPQGFDTEETTKTGISLMSRRGKKGKETPFRKLRVVFSLEERHLLLTAILSIFSGSKDVVAFEFQPQHRSPINLEIIPSKEKRIIQREKNRLLEMDTVELAEEVRTSKVESKEILESIDAFFEIKASSARTGQLLLARVDLLKDLVDRQNELVRISINRKRDPSIRIMTSFNSGAKIEEQKLFFQKLTNFTIAFAERISDVGGKIDRGGYKGRRLT